jgi:23S rRNA pseudouridine955/2504/2580 synthase
MFLHAARLNLPHPLTGNPIALKLEIPNELQQFVDQLDNDIEQKIKGKNG